MRARVCGLAVGSFAALLSLAGCPQFEQDFTIADGDGGSAVAFEGSAGDGNPGLEATLADASSSADFDSGEDQVCNMSFVACVSGTGLVTCPPGRLPCVGENPCNTGELCCRECGGDGGIEVSPDAAGDAGERVCNTGFGCVSGSGPVSCPPGELPCIAGEGACNAGELCCRECHYQ